MQTLQLESTVSAYKLWSMWSESRGACLPRKRRESEMAGPRAEATAKAIEEAALDLALDKGYEAVTVDLVCEVAGVSQRTFFNHFPTKDDALVGRYRPFVDEQAARRFIVGRGPLLPEALAVVAPPRPVELARLQDRMRVIETSPVLLAKHLAQIAQLDDEIRDLVALRLRNQHPDREATDIQEEAEMLSGVLGSVLRWVGQSIGRSEDAGASGAHDAAIERAHRIMGRMIADSSLGADEEPDAWERPSD